MKTAYLVGAGPGDPELLTIKAMKALEQAEVVIYDRLIDKRILDYIPPHTEKIYVGKAPYKSSANQAEINKLILKKIKQNKKVVRLKGGDPFVFGRGGEEAEFLAQHNIPFEIVPGITSATAVPAYAGIPVTHRDYTSTFAVITGNEDPQKKQSAIPWKEISSIGTLIFLMGIYNLESIIEKLLASGRDPESPVAIIREGTKPTQKTVTGNLKNIVLQAKKEGIKPPAIIIIGNVVKLREKLNWYESKPLFGKKIIVTRAREQASSLSRKLEQAGAQPLEFPVIRISPVENYHKLDKALKKIEDFHWLIFTSPNGVKYFMNRLYQLNLDVRSLKGIKTIAIGPVTAAELKKWNLNADYVPEEYSAEGILKGIGSQDIQGKNILIPRASQARKLLVEKLREKRANIEEIAIYKTELDTSFKEIIIKMLTNKEVDAITFTSSSTVNNFILALEEKYNDELLKNIAIACIGPITAKTAIEKGLHVDVIAEKYTTDYLVKGLKDYFQKQKC